MKELTPPTKWMKSKTGTVAEVTGTVRRDHQGHKIYRLRYEEGVRGSRGWTIDELMESASRWLKNKPRGWGRQTK